MSVEVDRGPATPGLVPGAEISVVAVRGIPDIEPGDGLAGIVLNALRDNGITLRPHDVVVVTHKVVSKAEGRLVELEDVEPDAQALALAERTGGDPRVVAVVLEESRAVLRAEPGVLVCETHHGLVCANAGVDRSNVGSDVVSLLPLNPDASARALRDAWLAAAGGGPLGVVISDSFGRPFREGQCNVAIGVAGIPATTDYRGMQDTEGMVMQASVLATADEIASAAELVMGKVECVPVAVVRGLRWVGEGGGSAELLRDRARDVFRR